MGPAHRSRVPAGLGRSCPGPVVFQSTRRSLAAARRVAEAHLRASLKYNPRSTASHFFLAELLLDQGRVADARAELQQVLDAPLDPEWTPEDREFKDKAQALLGRTAGR